MITLPKNLKEIGDGAFRGCESLEGEVLVPSGLQRIGTAAFAGTNITKITVQHEDREETSDEGE